MDNAEIEILFKSTEGIGYGYTYGIDDKKPFRSVMIQDRLNLDLIKDYDATMGEIAASK